MWPSSPLPIAKEYVSLEPTAFDQSKRGGPRDGDGGEPGRHCEAFGYGDGIRMGVRARVNVADDSSRGLDWGTVWLGRRGVAVGIASAEIVCERWVTAPGAFDDFCGKSISRYGGVCRELAGRKEEKEGCEGSHSG